MRLELALCLFALLGLVGCSNFILTEESAIATKNAIETMTEQHLDEVQTVIETLYLESGSLETKLHRQYLSSVVTGEYLEKLMSLEFEDGVFLITQSVMLDEVRVIEYSPSTFKAIACGTLQLQEVTEDGELLRSLDPWNFLTVYAFVSENTSWKLAAAYDFRDVDGARRDWEYVSDWERSYIGDLPNIISSHFDCGFNS